MVVVFERKGKESLVEERLVGTQQSVVTEVKFIVKRQRRHGSRGLC